MPSVASPSAPTAAVSSARHSASNEWIHAWVATCGGDVQRGRLQSHRDQEPAQELRVRYGDVVGIQPGLTQLAAVALVEPTGFLGAVGHQRGPVLGALEAGHDRGQEAGEAATVAVVLAEEAAEHLPRCRQLARGDDVQQRVASRARLFGVALQRGDVVGWREVAGHQLVDERAGLRGRVGAKRNGQHGHGGIS